MNSYRKTIDQAMMRYQMAKKKTRQEWGDLKRAKKREKNIQKAHEAIQEIAKQVQISAHRRIAGIVTRCLEVVWGDRYSFQILFEKKRGKTEARLVFVRDDGLVLDPLAESSGGVIDVAAFALRLACLLMSRPTKRRLVVLDEPFKNVRGQENQNRVREMVEQIAKELDFQIIMNTDMEWIRVGTLISLED